MSDDCCQTNKNEQIDNEWEAVHAQFREKEKQLTRARDELNAERRQLPKKEVTNRYSFQGASGEVEFSDLFEDAEQLIVYHFMFAPDWEEGCNGCSMMVDNMGHVAHLKARRTRLVLISRAPLAKLIAFQKRMGWTVPWYSSYNNTFNKDFKATLENGEETHGYSVFQTDGERIFHTYSTWNRGVEYLGTTFSYLDMTPLGRQEKWEQAPQAVKVKQTDTYEWWRHHDRYKNE